MIDIFDGKALSDIDRSDIERLIDRGVAEGYYVEYKSQPPGNDKIAKSIASFANTEGGWYIIGLRDDGTNVAAQIVGMKIAEWPNLTDSIRDTIGSHIDPCPLFFIRSIEVSNDEFIIVVQVPANQDTPFICKDARVYRRTADSSEPIKENDRYALDRIYNRGRENAERFDDFAIDERSLDRKEADSSWISIYVSPYPDGSVLRSEITSTPAQRAIIKRSNENIPILSKTLEERVPSLLAFNYAATSSLGTWFRHTMYQDPECRTLEMKLDVLGRAKIHVPIRVELVHTIPPVVSKNLKVYLPSHSLSVIRPFDIGDVWHATLAALAFYFDWIGDDVSVSRFRVAIETKKTWRLVPYVASSVWADHIKEFGVPIISTDSSRLPGTQRGGIMRDSKKDIEIEILHLSSAALGIPKDIVGALFADSLRKTKKN